MKSGTRWAITAVLLVAFGGAIWFAVNDQQHTQQQQQIEQAQREIESVEAMVGLVSVDVEPFFADERVQTLLRERKLPVRAMRVGSRDMAAKVGTASAADFYLPSGVLAANQIVDAAGKLGVSFTQTAPFNSPMVVASFKPIADILVANDLAKARGDTVFGLNNQALIKVMLNKQRWADLKQSDAFSVQRSVLVSTTDIRKSNSAAMYLALASQALAGDVVADRAAAEAAAVKLADLFKRQGYQENYVNGNFDDYIQIGMGKTPLAFMYEYQMVGHALKKGIRPEMVLIYPEPTIVNKFVMLAGSARARALQQELSSNSALHKIAVEYGLRVPDTAVFMAAVKPSGLSVQEHIVQLTDPPSHDLMTHMIDVVTREMAQ
jgi:hypothetical protein